MFYKFIDLSKVLVRSGCKCQRFGEGLHLVKGVAPNPVNAQTKILTFRTFFFTVPKDEISKFLPLGKKRSLLVRLTNELKQMRGLKENTLKMKKSCISLIEFVLAHRVRRAQQIFSLYTKLWDDKALNFIISRLRKQFLSRGHAFMLGLSAASVFNWGEEMITDDDILRFSRELEMCHKLKERTNGLGKRTSEEIIDDDGPCVPCAPCDSPEVACWEPFVATGDLTCWRREAPNRKGSGLYCYKIYGVYKDVSANDFLEASLDIKERKNWDSHAVNLHVIESHPSSNSDIIYWETKWPSLFKNRDYVFNRRFKILKKENIMILCNKSSSHPNYPLNPSKTRVTEYWSYLVIKPFTTFSESGIEFSLTYYDDPGTSLPSAISSWAATTGMPEFMKKLRFAAMKVAENRKSSTSLLTPSIQEEILMSNEESENTTETNETDEEKGTDDLNPLKIFGFVYPPSNEDELLFHMLIT